MTAKLQAISIKICLGLQDTEDMVLAICDCNYHTISYLANEVAREVEAKSCVALQERS